MKKKHIGLLLLIPIIIIAFLYTSKIQKDKWAKESPEIKYSEDREKEVWGGVLRGDDAGLFYGTPLYDLAKEMTCFSKFRSDEKIEKLINEIPKEYINFQDDKYGTTTGHFALRINNISVIPKLLDKGLNPDLLDKSGNALIIDINDFYINPSEKKQILMQMIKKGANVNLFSQKSTTSTPLIRASQSGNLENVKILIEAGADPHFINESTWMSSNSALNVALERSHIDVVNYLIFDQKVDFKAAKYPMDSKFHPGEYMILHNLREMTFKINSKDFQEKMRLVAYLKTQGLDYWKTPIPDNIKNNPHFTKEYLSKY